MKRAIRELIEMSQRNYDLELEGRQLLPFVKNRLFLGNPGTGPRLASPFFWFFSLTRTRSPSLSPELFHSLSHPFPFFVPPGKTTCAELYGKILKCLNLLSIGDVVKKTASDFIGQYVGQSQTNTSSILRESEGKVLIIDEAYALNDQLYGKEALNVIVEKVQGGPYDDIAVLLLGYEDQMLEMIRTQNPGLARRFPRECAFVFEDYTLEELLLIYTSACQSYGVESTPEAAEAALKALKKQMCLPNFGNAGAVQNILKIAMNRAMLRKESRVVLIPSDFGEASEGENGKKEERDPLTLLDELVNVEGIRRSLKALQDELIVAEREGNSSPPVGHFVFTGSPGTGGDFYSVSFFRFLV